MANLKDVVVPDIGGFDAVEVIDVLVAVGETVALEDSLITLESDKAAMDIPAPYAGVIKEMKLTTGDKVAQGSLILVMEAEDAPEAEAPIASEPAAAPAAAPQAVAPAKQTLVQQTPQLDQRPVIAAGKAHASPSVRRFARELGVDVSRVAGSGQKGRVLKADVKAFVKGVMLGGGAIQAAPDMEVMASPKVDFSKFGATETKALGRIKKISGPFLHSAWVRIPHVTQFDECEITDIEKVRKGMAAEAVEKGTKLTPLVFIMKAVVAALKEFPHVNASLDESKEKLILKKYFNIGVAVDTPEGLMVPVIRDVDKKDVFQLSTEVRELAGKARDRKLKATDLQGGCFSISSLGGIGGTNFTPIINAPEVAILGVARAKMQPVYQADSGAFRAGMILPMSLSYDHRVIDGADGVRFTRFLCELLEDPKKLMDVS